MKLFRIFRKKKKAVVTFEVPKGAKGDTYYCGTGCMYGEFTPTEPGLYKFRFDENGKLQTIRVITDNND